MQRRVPPGRASSTLFYGQAKPAATGSAPQERPPDRGDGRPSPREQKFSPPPEGLVPKAALQVMKTTPTVGTMAETPQRGSRLYVAIKRSAHVAILLGLVVFLISSNLERLSPVVSKFFPAADAVELEGSTPHMLFVRSNPEGASVWINGNRMGRTPYAQGYSHSTKKIHLRVEARGYAAWEAELPLDAAGVNVVATLERAGKRALKPMLIAGMVAPAR